MGLVDLFAALHRGDDGVMTALSRVLLVFALVIGPALSSVAAEGDEDLVITIFWGDGCPHCAAEWQFLGDLSEEYPDLEILGYEVWYDAANQAYFTSTMERLGMEARSVPTTIFAGRVWEGYSPAVGAQIRAAVASALPSTTGTTTPPIASPEVIDVPLIGEVDVGGMSLAASTVLIALVDGINPCSLWVLSILLALVLRTGSRRRVVAIGGTFLAVTAMLYGLYIAGMYGFLTYAAGQTWVRMAMAVIALGFGVVNLKDYFWYGRGYSLSIPESRKPAMYRRMRSVAAEGESLPVALAGTALLAVGVSLVETPCTAGYPLLWANLLTAHEVTPAGAIPLFGLYMLVFLLDELVVFGAAVIAMRATKLEERAGRLLKLVSGVVMIALAATLLLFPEAMSSLIGAMAVFGIALLVVLLILTAGRVATRRRPPPAQPGRREPVAPGVGKKPAR
jgi:thiol-disulfide isomerase/thioredoxin